MKLEQLNKELEDIFSSIEFEEDGGIHITGADWFSDDLKLEFAIKTGVEEQNQLWEAQIKGVREEMIKAEMSEKLELLEEHPLLWAYNQRQTNLYFSKPTSRSYELFANIYTIHNRETRNWIPLRKYINTHLSVLDLCKSTSGLFASGPIKLMEQYKKELEAHDMNPTIVGGHSPKRWLNGHQVDETEIVQVLIIGDSYIIGEAFEFNRV
ncbi:MAG: hypothetical protein HYR67_12670 [Bacteroidetes bacterium]|nr:hypothetical protein [Bacteroidota bacterium]